MTVVDRSNYHIMLSKERNRNTEGMNHNIGSIDQLA